MENELNKEQPEEVVWPVLPHQCTQLEASTDICTEEILVHVLDEFDAFEPTNEEEIVNEILKDLMGKDDKFLDSFIAKVAEDFNNFNYVHGKAHLLDNSNFGVEHGQVSPKIQQIHHEFVPQVSLKNVILNCELLQ